MKYIYIILFASIFSCKQDEIPKQPDGWKYAGMDVGTYRIYEVETWIITSEVENNYDLNEDSTITYSDGIDTVFSYIKEVVDRKIIDQEGDSVFVLERYYSNTLEFDNTPDSVWTAKFHNNQYLRTENNQKYAKMVFPIDSDRLWDYNAHNAKPLDNAEYSEIRTSVEVKSQAYNDVVVVEVEKNVVDDDEIFDNDALTDVYEIRREYYAANIGLIKSENILLKNCQNGGQFCNLDFFIIQSGSYKILRLVDSNL